jgi:hypothetical protein
MLQVFCMDVVKVDRDIAYVAMVVYALLQTSVLNVWSIFSDICCKCVCLDVAYVSHICCKCFLWMLRMCCNDFSSISCVFCKYFRRMFQMFHLSSDVCCKCVPGYFKSRSGVASHFSPWCLLLAFFSLASMSNCGGGTMEADGGGVAWTWAHGLPFYYTGMNVCMLYMLMVFR